MNFGVPKKRGTTKVEKYPNEAVATLVIAEDGKGRKILFNEKAVEMMGLPEEDAVVAFSFDNGITVLNGDQAGIPDVIKIKVTKSEPRKISDKKTYEYIIDSLGLDDQVENEFDLMRNDRDGLTCFDFSPKVEFEEEVNETEAVTSNDTFTAIPKGEPVVQ